MTATEAGRRHPHGSRAAYVSGCHCDRCREANARYMTAWRRGLRGSHQRRLGPFVIAGADNPADLRTL
jgi:hypothetical protein